MGNAGRVLMIPKGEYNSATTYEMLDFVYYQGRSYVCKQTSTGNAPTNTTYWQALTGDASAEIQALTNYVLENNVKNICPFDMAYIKSANTTSWNGNTYTQNNASFVYDNGTVTTSGVPSAVTSPKYAKFSLPAGDYIMSGCPAGGSNTTYALWVGVRNASDTDWIANYKDYGNGVAFTIPADASYVRVETEVRPAYDGSTKVFKPMIRDASITDPTYQPYAKTNVELTQELPQIESGTTAFTDGNEKVNFSKAFSTAPNVIAIPKYTTVTTGETPLLLKVYDVTTTYFRVRAIDNTGANVSTFTNATSFMWQAMS